VADHTASGVIAPDHPSLAGHFPGHPVVPAVVLLDFAARALGDALGRRVRLTAVPAAKFLHPLLPGQRFSVELELDPAARSARFRARTAVAEVAQGRLEYADEA
jgi:3-hydroxymyristoyl/3-hydroxydecanoyl-(acyl carrier protein) dehydratase